MVQAGIKDTDAQAAARVRQFLIDQGVLVPTRKDCYTLGPGVRVTAGRQHPKGAECC